MSVVVVSVWFVVEYKCVGYLQVGGCGRGRLENEMGEGVFGGYRDTIWKA